MALTCKQLARAWGIAVTKVTQAREPTFRKMARAMLMFPTETITELSEAMATERDKSSRWANWPDAISDRELSLREDMLRGRADRETIHPSRGNEATRQRGSKATTRQGIAD